MCGYGKYFLDGACHDVESESANQGCDAGAHMTVATDASFMGPNRDAPYCNGDYHLYDYITNTENRIYPIYHGTLLFIGTEMKVNTFDEMSKNTGKKFDTLYIVGGGAKNTYLNELTEKICNIKVVALPIEATALGNLKIQIESKQ